MKVGYANLGEKYTVNFFVLGLSLYNWELADISVMPHSRKKGM